MSLSVLTVTLMSYESNQHLSANVAPHQQAALDLLGLRNEGPVP